MARFEVTVSEMQNAANKISQAANDFLNAAGQTFTAAQTLADSWEGDSQVAFVAEQQKANEWYKKMVEIVNTYVTNLQNAAKSYQQADAESAANIKSH
jgi:WXG100 family type VII secretion target